MYKYIIRFIIVKKFIKIIRFSNIMKIYKKIILNFFLLLIEINIVTFYKFYIYKKIMINLY